MSGALRELKIAIVSASLSEHSSTDRLGSKIAQAAQREIEAAGGGQIAVQLVPISLKSLAHSITNALLTGFPDGPLEQAFAEVESAQAVIALTPAYNASYSGLFKSFFDVLDEDTLRGKPMVIGATGGTARHSLVTEHAMRPMFVYLHAFVTPTSLFVATEDWGAAAHGSDGSAGSTLDRRIVRAAKELVQLLIVRSEPGAGDSDALVTREAVNMAQLDGIASPRATASPDDKAALNAVASPKVELALDANATPRAGGLSRGKGYGAGTARATASLDPEQLANLAPEELYPEFKSFDQLLR